MRDSGGEGEEGCTCGVTPQNGFELSHGLFHEFRKVREISHEPQRIHLKISHMPSKLGNPISSEKSYDQIK